MEMTAEKTGLSMKKLTFMRKFVLMNYSSSFFALFSSWAGSCTRTFIPGVSLWNPS